MSYLRLMAVFGTAAVIAALAGCSSSSDVVSPGGSSPVSNAQVSNDMATVTAPDAAGDVSDFASEGNNGTTFSVVSGRAGGLSAAAVTCGPTTTINVEYVYGKDNQDTVDFNRTREWFAGGACATAFSPSVDSVEYVGTWLEHLAGANAKWSVRANRVRHAAVFGAPSLDSATSHVWNANALVNDTVQVMGSVNTRDYTGVAYDTATAITFNHPRNGDRYPESGTWTRWATWTLNVTGAKTETKTVSRHIVVTFSGGSNDAQLQIYDIATNTVALTCTIDLLAHEIVPGSCH